MKVKTSEVKKFVDASYKTKKTAPKKIGDYVLDEKLSNKKAKVYHDPVHDKTIIANRGTTGTISDWANNAKYATDVMTGNVFNLYNKSDRFQQAKRTQKNALKKYGTIDSNIGHSQSGIITRKLNKKGLTDQVININPASYYDKPKKNEYVYRSTFDPVSILATGANTASDFILNPIKAHSSKFLKKYHKKYLGGAIDKNDPRMKIALDYINDVITSNYDDTVIMMSKYNIEQENETDVIKIIIKQENPKVFNLLYPEEASEIGIIKKIKKVEKPKKEKVEKPKKEKVEKPKSDKPTIKETKKMYKEMRLEEKKKADREHEMAMEKIMQERMSDPKILMMDEIMALNKYKVPSLKSMLKQRKIKLSKNGKPLKKAQMIGILSDEIVMKYQKLIPVSKNDILDLIIDIKKTNIEDKSIYDNIQKQKIDKLFNKVDKTLKKVSNIKKADQFRKNQLMKKIFNAMKVVDKTIDKPFDVDTFQDITNFDLLFYKKEYYLRDLETSIIYSIKNDLPFERVGIYDITKNKIKLDVKPLSKVDENGLNNIKKADEFYKKKLMKKVFENIKNEKVPIKRNRPPIPKSRRPRINTSELVTEYIEDPIKIINPISRPRSITSDDVRGTDYIEDPIKHVKRSRPIPLPKSRAQYDIVFFNNQKFLKNKRTNELYTIKNNMPYQKVGVNI